jgi:DNA-binding winged helix-turn-helix (wHTH) protein
MSLNEKYICPHLWALAGGVCLLILQSVWIFQTYEQEHNCLVTGLKEAFTLAYQKEQTYRIPVVDIVNPGEVSIQSCGNEEIMIIRKCSPADTIVYENISGRSIEKFVDRVFRDLRENITPMNIYCLSDLYAGILHDKDIPIVYVIERYRIDTDAVLETTLPPDKQRLQTPYDNIIVIETSDAEAVRAILQITPGIIFRNMSGILACTFAVAIFILFCIALMYKNRKQEKKIEQTDIRSGEPQSAFHVGQFQFDPFKNELQGFGEIIQLNKKENSILHALCMQQGNVVERKTLLLDNWGSSGIIYSRSLDTYLASLRKYLKKDPSIQIVTIKGAGYKLVHKEI